MRRLIIANLLILTSLWAQIPNGYYDPAAGLSGPTLQQALHDIIDNHNAQSYSALWTAFQTTDVKPNGKVWDMYSDIPGGTPPYEYTFGSDQCGNYSGEGSCYNREHSWPKSWFNNGTPMYTDLFHLVPTDGYVNSQRSNYPYGEVSNPTWISQNGSKRGPCSYPGYSGTVFEPIDAYKGDFARNYFYMSTRYLNEDNGWAGSPMVNGSQLVPWALNMLLEWAAEDPVSQKELDRNNAVYAIQNNRNPYIDHPEYTALVWGGALPGPAAPSNLQAVSITETGLTLTWSDNANNEDGFYVYQNSSLIETLGADLTTLAVNGLEAATSYTFGVAAYNTAGNSSTISLVVSTSGGGNTVNHFVEDFETANGSTYYEGDLVLPSGTWNLYQAGNFTLGTPYSGNRCLAINDDKSGAQITTPSVNTLGTLSFYYYQRNGASDDEFQVQKAVNGGAFETIATQNYNVGETYTLFTLAVNESATDVRIRILNDDQAGHLILDDIAVSNYDPVSLTPEPVLQAEKLSLTGNYPNPFNPETTISFVLPAAGKRQLEGPASSGVTTLLVYDLHGRLVDSLVNSIVNPGSYSVTWNAGNAPAGIYLLLLSNGSETAIRRITLLR